MLKYFNNWIILGESRPLIFNTVNAFIIGTTAELLSQSLDNYYLNKQISTMMGNSKKAPDLLPLHRVT